MWSLTTPTFCMNAYTLVGDGSRCPLAGDRVGLRELGHRRDLGDVEAPECLPERVPFPEYDRPAQPDLEHAQGERLEHRRLVVGAGTPDLVVVPAEGGIAGAGPGAAWLPVVPDDHVAAHPALQRPGPPAPESPRLPLSRRALRFTGRPAPSFTLRLHPAHHMFGDPMTHAMAATVP